MSGFIINIEGTDGSGKATQANKLTKALIDLGYDALEKSFPNYESKSSGPVKMYLDGEIGESADCVNYKQASVLFAVDRLCTMRTKDYQDKILVLDRYTPSNMIHQCCKIKNVEEQLEFLDWLDDFEFNFLELPRPNLIIFLDMPIEKSLELAHQRKDLKAGTKKDIHEQDSEYMKRAYQTGKSVALKFGWTIIKCVDENDNIKSVEDIHKEILDVVLEKLK
ncbi:MAG: deoxynucleoside kinase [Clostridia bacterium]|nr:deoxynucleoside kinase [Clostridia bacterium]